MQKKIIIEMMKSDQVKTVLESHEFYRDKLSDLRKSWNLSDDCSESYSGRGSCTDTTEDIRENLPKIIKNYNIKSITDSPCGDWNWMRLVNLDGINYIGYDVIDEIINSNINNYSSDSIKFEIKDIINDDIQKSDLIICRDFTFHISNDNVLKLLDNFRKSGSKYLLTTSFENVDVNIDISFESKGYGFRKVNLRNHPFNLNEYLYGFVETHPENLGRGMYLWKIN
jgi:hypothetical protein